MKSKKSSKEEIRYNYYFKDTIIELRKEKKMKQSEFAELIGVVPQTLSKWENGESVPDAHTLRNICVECNVSPNELLFNKKDIRTYFRRICFFFEKVFIFIFKYIISLLFLITIIPLFLFWINNKETVTMYDLKQTNENIYIEHGYLLKTKHQNILSISNITLKGVNNPNNIHLELYVYTRGDKYILYEANNLDNIYIEELNRYTMYLNNDFMNAIVNDLHLDITFTDDNEHERNYNTTIIFNKRFSNNKIIYHYYNNHSEYNSSYLYYKDNISKYDVEIQPKYNLFNNDPKANDLENKLSNLGYKYDLETNTYVNNYDGNIIIYHPINKNIEYKIEKNSLEYRLVYHSDYERIDYKIYNKDIRIMNLKYLIQEKYVDCIEGECENYLDDINDLLNIYEEINQYQF